MPPKTPAPHCKLARTEGCFRGCKQIEDEPGEYYDVCWYHYRREALAPLRKEAGIKKKETFDKKMEVLVLKEEQKIMAEEEQRDNVGDLASSLRQFNSTRFPGRRTRSAPNTPGRAPSTPTSTRSQSAPASPFRRMRRNVIIDEAEDDNRPEEQIEAEDEDEAEDDLDIENYEGTPSMDIEGRTPPILPPPHNPPPLPVIPPRQDLTPEENALYCSDVLTLSGGRIGEWHDVVKKTIDPTINCVHCQHVLGPDQSNWRIYRCRHVFHLAPCADTYAAVHVRELLICPICRVET